MQQLQPEMKRIQKEFKDDRQRQNEELMKFYKENNINPLSSCLPLLVQMPVFIILYQVLSGLTRQVEDGGTFDPKYLEPSTALYQSLSGHTSMDWLGFDLAISPSTALGEGFTTFLPYGIMIVIVLVTGYVQQAQIQGRAQNQSVNPQQQMIMKILPLFIGIISFGLPGALVLYFVTSNLFRVGQQWLITRTIYADAPVPEVIDADSAPVGKGKADKGKADKATKPAKPGTGTTSKRVTEPKGRPTPNRNGESPKGKNKRTSSSGRAGATSSLPQPRPRKKKR
jgi:YidC/Oxa1 family membrane protein insertase